MTHDAHPEHCLALHIADLTRQQLAPSPPRRQALRWLTGLGALPLVGCGGGDAEGSTGSSSSTSSSTGSTSGTTTTTSSSLPHQRRAHRDRRPLPGRRRQRLQPDAERAGAVGHPPRRHPHQRGQRQRHRTGGTHHRDADHRRHQRQHLHAAGGLRGVHLALHARRQLLDVLERHHRRELPARRAGHRRQWPGDLTTIFPGCYSGRWPHIHFEVYSSLSAAVDSTSVRDYVKVSQLAVPAAACSQVHGVATGYSASVANFAAISLASDNVFSDGSSLQVAGHSGNVTDGFALNLTVAVS